MSDELIKSLIQPTIIVTLTVVGWLITIWWAKKHINISAKKNLELQRLLIQENTRRESVKEIINIFKNVAGSLSKLSQSCVIFHQNFILETSELKKTINFSASNLVDPINEAYAELYTDMRQLDMWLRISKPSIPHPEEIQEVIDYYFKSLTTASMNSDQQPWLIFQGILTFYRAGKLKENENLSKTLLEVLNVIKATENMLVNVVTKINHEMIKAPISSKS